MELKSNTELAIWNPRLLNDLDTDNKVIGVMVSNVKDSTLHTKHVCGIVDMGSAEEFCDSLEKWLFDVRKLMDELRG